MSLYVFAKYYSLEVDGYKSFGERREAVWSKRKKAFFP